ncbi:MAG TPA: sugar ABC transporter permease [Stellaceae bacterium]|jgi:multiple sugar transport system permease protein|nr:sugar ABC transporter permease [Stellaceae bacterium]
MRSTEQALGLPPLAMEPRRRRPAYRRGGELAWAAAFVMPYATVFVAFAGYPLVVALWMGRDPALYRELYGERLYWLAVLNTVLFVGIGVNLKMVLALLLSGFFLQRRWWIKPLLVIFVVPWFLATVQAFISFHWMLIGEYGLIDGVLDQVFGIEGPTWFNHYPLALGSNIIAFAWKWLPLWTLILLAGRLAIPREIYEAAAVDGAGGVRRFAHVTVPMLANLYLVCTLLAAIWGVGDFATAYFVSGGTPVHATDVIATLSYRFAFEDAHPALGIAVSVTMLPVLIPLGVLLMRRLQRGLQL